MKRVKGLEFLFFKLENCSLRFFQNFSEGKREFEQNTLVHTKYTSRKGRGNTCILMFWGSKLFLGYCSVPSSCGESYCVFCSSFLLAAPKEVFFLIL